MFFKIVYNKELHVYNPKNDTSFEAMHKYIKEVFKQIPARYYLTYFDEEDEITLACDSDFETLKQIAQKTVKIFIKEVDQSYYDQTQKVVLDDEMLEPLEEKMEELKLSESEDHAEPEQHKPIESQIQAPKISSPIVTNQTKPEEPNSQPQIIEEKPVEKLDQYNPILDQSEMSCSQISQITEAQIEEKFRQMIPEFMEKVKDSLLKKSNVQSQPSQKPTIVHNHIICDECGKNNIEGVRYKCAVCADFDLCEKCQATSTHDHPFLKIKHPRQAPYKLIAIIRDEEQNAFEVNGQRVTIPQIPFVNQLFQAFCPRPGRQPNERFGHHGPRNWFARGRHGCPYRNRQETNNQQKMNEKCEEKMEPQKKAKIEQEKPVQKKVEQKCQEKIENNVSVDQKTQPEQRKEQMQAENFSSNEHVENAKYLFSVLNGFAQISEAQCHDFSLKHPGNTKEQLLELYFSQKF